MTRVLNSIVMIGLAVFLAVGVTMALPEGSGQRATPPSGAAIPMLQVTGISKVH